MSEKIIEMLDAIEAKQDAKIEEGKVETNKLVDEIAIQTVKAVSDKPHGIFGVDMAYDKDGIPNPTEINISRFFTTVLFFTEAGLNMPEIFKDLILYNEKPKLEKIINLRFIMWNVKFLKL